MSKRLIICTDGTWNPVESINRRVRTSTNVAKVAALVAPQCAEGQTQLVCYVQGVGTHEEDVISGGAFGWGLSANIERAYRFLVNHYEPGDEIYLFGFSRGAFTARSLSGLIRNSGIVRTASQEAIDAAFQLYKDRRDETDPDSIRSRVFRLENSHEAKIRFIGVWDTVGSLGMPFLRHRIAKMLGWDWRFHDTTLGPHIEHASHAIAIHETRSKFLPTLWRKSPENMHNQLLEQMWFSGCHADIGGGYIDTSLSDLSLEWLVGRAASAGLHFNHDWKAQLDRSGQKFAPSALGSIKSEFKGFYPYLDALSGCPNGVLRQMGLVDQYCKSIQPRPPIRSLSCWLPNFIAYIARRFLKRRKTTVTSDEDTLTCEALHPSVIERYKERMEDDWWPPQILKLLEQQSGFPQEKPSPIKNDR